MDLSIRVIALILCVTEVTSHQDTHTYRLSKFLKISAAPSRLIRQQQRSEIMKRYLHLVKHFVQHF
jgi:DNA-directed RNA polymerase specialized sigma subunit